MTDTLREKLWRTMQAHGVGWIDNGTDLARCYCGHRPDRLGASWHAHVADAVIAEIGLREEMKYPGGTFSFTPPQRRRYVTDWVTDE